MNAMMIEEIKKELERKVSEGTTVEFVTVAKNNGIERQGFTIRIPGAVIFPTIYVEEQLDLVRNGFMTPEDVADYVLETAEENKASESMNNAIENLSKQMILENVQYQLVNKETNWSELDQTTHKDFLDLTAIYRVMLDNNSSFVVRNSLMWKFDISFEELDEAARQNTEDVGFLVRSMASVIAELHDIPEEMLADNPMLMMSNKRGALGAAIMLYPEYFKKVANAWEDDLYILPSSIHELIALPASKMEAEELRFMVKEVNDNEVALEERLSYNVYRYDRETGELRVA